VTLEVAEKVKLQVKQLHHLCQVRRIKLIPRKKFAPEISSLIIEGLHESVDSKNPLKNSKNQLAIYT
jgi:hypothetical protein